MACCHQQGTLLSIYPALHDFLSVLSLKSWEPIWMINATYNRSNFFYFKPENISFSPLKTLYSHSNQESWFFIGPCAYLSSAQPLPSIAEWGHRAFKVLAPCGWAAQIHWHSCNVKGFYRLSPPTMTSLSIMKCRRAQLGYSLLGKQVLFSTPISSSEVLGWDKGMWMIWKEIKLRSI